MKQELTFEEFSKKLEGMNERCGSCKYLEYQKDRSYCRKKQIEMSNTSPKCENWRYFG